MSLLTIGGDCTWVADRGLEKPGAPEGAHTYSRHDRLLMGLKLVGLLIRSLIRQRPGQPRQRFHRAQQAGGARKYAWEIAYKKVGDRGGFVALCDTGRLLGAKNVGASAMCPMML